MKKIPALLGALGAAAVSTAALTSSAKAALLKITATDASGLTNNSTSWIFDTDQCIVSTNYDGKPRLELKGPQTVITATPSLNYDMAIGTIIDNGNYEDFLQIMAPDGFAELQLYQPITIDKAKFDTTQGKLDLINSFTTGSAMGTYSPTMWIGFGANSQYDNIKVTMEPTSIPEPSSLMLGASAAGLLGLRRRRSSVKVGETSVAGM